MISVAYYIGPMCTSDGAGVVLTLFTDRYCTIVDTSGAFLTSNGYSLPFSDPTKNLVSKDFYSCVDQHYYTLNNMCTSLYPLSAKCEIGMKGVVASPTISGCNYVNSVEVIQMHSTPSISANGAAKTFSWIFFFSSLVLGYYCYKLMRKTKPKLMIYENSESSFT